MKDLRFGFGRNWQGYLSTLTENQIEIAKQSLLDPLALTSLKGLKFLDVGCGSGLSSLVARHSGATVHSFDYDHDSVTCTQSIKEKYNPQDTTWTIEQGSALDEPYLKSLGKFDIVYAWGVLHHTGHMDKALHNVGDLVVEGGSLFISIYNDQGWKSRAWRGVKKAYNRSPSFLKPFILWPCTLWLWRYRIAFGLLRHGNPLKYIKNYGEQNRGMSAYYDAIDWVGGYPFEVASPEVIFDFYKERGFSLQHLKTRLGGLGCNEFVFRKDRQSLT